jgi:hypothetical protein
MADVELKVSADTKQAKAGFKELDSSLTTTKRGFAGVTTGLKGFSSALAAVGVGAVAGVFSIKAIIDVHRELQKVSAHTNLVVASMGPIAKQSFEAAKPQFATIGDAYAKTAKDAEKAFGIILNTSKDATTGIDDVEAALALVQATGVSVEQASKAIGEAMLGNIRPLEDLVGWLGSYETGMQRIIAAGKGATTVIDQVKTTFQQSLEDLLNFNIKDLLFSKELQEDWGKLMDYISDTVLPFLKNAFTETIPNFLKSIISDELKANFNAFFTELIPAAFGITINFLEGTFWSLIDTIKDWVGLAATGIGIAINFTKGVIDKIVETVLGWWESGKTAVNAALKLTKDLAGNAWETITKVTDWIANGVQAAFKFTTNVANAVWETITKVADWISEGIQIAFKFGTDKADAVWKIITKVTDWAKNGVRVVLNFGDGIIDPFISMVKGWLAAPSLLPVGAGSLSIMLSFIDGFLAPVIRTIKKWFEKGEQGVQLFFNFGLKIIHKLIERVAEWWDKGEQGVQLFFNFVVNTVDEVIETLLKWFKSRAEITVDFIEGFIPDWLKAIIKFITGMNPFSSSSTSSGSLTVPGLHAGGVVTKPTLAMIGEAGPEAVIPLGKGKGMGAGNSYTFIFNEAHIQDEVAANDLARDIANRIDINERRGT